jgi:hypothetical protein
MRDDRLHDHAVIGETTPSARKRAPSDVLLANLRAVSPAGAEIRLRVSPAGLDDADRNVPFCLQREHQSTGWAIMAA